MGLEERVEHGYADNGGVKIHYASLGSGPLIVMIHGFPDYWYTWRSQMEALSADYQCVAMDLRGYNLSDKPKGVDNYAMAVLVEDVAAVVKHVGRDKAIVVGHDWGGATAWAFAMAKPQMLDRLIILNVPHPLGFARELVNNPRQQRSSQYARDYQKEGAHLKVTVEDLSFWVTDPEAKEKYREAFERSDVEAMLNYYKRNFLKEGSSGGGSERDYPPVKAPVLIIYGLKDKYVLPAGLNNTWEWLEKGLTLVTIPEAGHFVQHEAADLVTRTIQQWLAFSEES
jgi:pimeloyl-ACP methyl ester carboxylesterase